jgi:ribosomal protein S18 acetylase RimI-like enzyme
MVREASTADITSIRSLMQGEPGFWQPWWSDRTVAEAIRSADGLAFVWEENSEILGLVCPHDLGFRAYLSELVVGSGARHRGIGTRLVQAVEEALRGKDLRVLIADVWRDAEPFYRSLGWEPPDVLLQRQLLKPRN